MTISVYTFRYICGLTVLITHGLVCWWLFSTTRFGDMWESRYGAILILGPVTLAYLIPFIKYVVMYPEGSNERPWKMLAYLTLYLVVAGYCYFLGYIVWNFAQGPMTVNTDQLKFGLGGLETGFGGMIAVIFEKLFGIVIQKHDDKPELKSGGQKLMVRARRPIVQQVSHNSEVSATPFTRATIHHDQQRRRRNAVALNRGPSATYGN
jgi:hypothetical protein